MKETEAVLGRIGLGLPSILLPSDAVDPGRFSVIACDQFSAQPEYWREVEDIVGGSPSALRITLPEVFLGDNDRRRIERINRTMREYLASGVLRDIGRGFVFLRRLTSTGIRRGLVAALDLERYDYSRGSKSLIRATEATVAERLPARVEIRRGAAIESTHIMVLIDDRPDSLMGFLEGRARSLKKLYDFDLMLGGGHIEGYFVGGRRDLLQIAGLLEGLNARSGDDFLYAVGDGNHSFAAAKECWELIKPSLSPAERERHPARYALVEIVNLHDPALLFEPIHRLLYNVDPNAASRELGLDGASPPDLQLLQPRIDGWLKSHPEAKLEYIHGERECLGLAARSPDRLAVILPPFDRGSLFAVVRERGAFVRKSFSLGGARDKRYYLECRAIK